MTGQLTSLPSFSNPPVVEVVCGVQFDPLEDLLAPHLGLFWQMIRANYPQCRERPPLVRRIESAQGSGTISLELGDVPPLPRMWFVSERDNSLLQIQRDLFLFNWRKVSDEDEYPRYPFVKAQFSDYWQRFGEFISQHDLGAITPRQYEMTYVNHISQGQGWERIVDVGHILPDCVWRDDAQRFLKEPESIGWRASFALPAGQGKLHAAMRAATHSKTQRPLFLLELTVRGFSVDGGEEAMWTWFDLARDWIVRAFVDLTGSEVQTSVWRKVR